MKLEGWIAIDVNDWDCWVADSDRGVLIQTTKEQKRDYDIEFLAPVPFTFTIPDPEASDGK